MTASNKYQTQRVEQGITTQDLTKTNQIVLSNSRQYWTNKSIGCLP